ncbi:MAG: biotin/lipoyl-binding protein [Firmicutes bacterium]|nr:biotin/lipoyl-binding protein [Bacillota bacterium]
MKKKKGKALKILIPIIILALVGGGVYLSKRLRTSPVEVASAANYMYPGWEEGGTMEGYITSGDIQKVRMSEGLVDSIKVKEGDKVKKGDILMVFDTTTHKLTLQKDKATIALIESEIRMNESRIRTLRGLKPSESAPKPTIEVIDHGKLVIRKKITTDTQSEKGKGANYFFNCSKDTIVKADFLRKLRKTGKTACFTLYDGNTKYAVWTVEGKNLPKEYYEKNKDSEKVKIDPLDSDWEIGKGLTFNGTGVQVDFNKAKASWGDLSSIEPEQYERYERIVHENYKIDDKGNYQYSKKELAEMIREAQEELEGKKLDLREANLTYRQDQLVGADGEVKATVSGTVREVKDPESVDIGDTLLEVVGGGDLKVSTVIGELDYDNVHKGDTVTIEDYMYGGVYTGTVEKKGKEPSDSQMYYYGNSNVSYYPVTVTIEDASKDLSVGDYVGVKFGASEEGGQSMYITKMFVRSDEQGSFCFVRGEDSRLEKRYIQTGKTLYGSEIEVISGLEMEDMIAFPYGKNVKEGAKTEEVDYIGGW